MLVFNADRRRECISQLKTPDGKLVDLPMNKPVEVAVTVPRPASSASRAAWTCSRRTVFAQPNG